MDRLFAARLGVLSFFWIELNGFSPSSQDITMFKLAISLRKRCPPKGRSVRHSCQPDLMFTKNLRLLGLPHSLEKKTALTAVSDGEPSTSRKSLSGVVVKFRSPQNCSALGINDIIPSELCPFHDGALGVCRDFSPC